MIIVNILLKLQMFKSGRIIISYVLLLKYFYWTFFFQKWRYCIDIGSNRRFIFVLNFNSTLVQKQPIRKQVIQVTWFEISISQVSISVRDKLSWSFVLHVKWNSDINIKHYINLLHFTVSKFGILICSSRSYNIRIHQIVVNFNKSLCM